MESDRPRKKARSVGSVFVDDEAFVDGSDSSDEDEMMIDDLFDDDEDNDENEDAGKLCISLEVADRVH